MERNWPTVDTWPFFSPLLSERGSAGCRCQQPGQRARGGLFACHSALGTVLGARHARQRNGQHRDGPSRHRSRRPPLRLEWGVMPLSPSVECSFNVVVRPAASKNKTSFTKKKLKNTRRSEAGAIYISLVGTRVRFPPPTRGRSVLAVESARPAGLTTGHDRPLKPRRGRSHEAGRVGLGRLGRPRRHHGDSPRPGRPQIVHDPPPRPAPPGSADTCASPAGARTAGCQGRRAAQAVPVPTPLRAPRTTSRPRPPRPAPRPTRSGRLLLTNSGVSHEAGNGGRPDMCTSSLPRFPIAAPARPCDACDA